MVRIDPLKYAQAEDTFEEVAAKVAKSMRIAQHLGVVIGFMLLGLLVLAILVVGKTLLGLL